MKKVYRHFATAAVFALISASPLCTPLSAEEIVIKSEPTVFLPVEYCRFEKIKTNLTSDEFAQDLKSLSYLLTNGYSGYEEMVEKGFNPQTFTETVSKKFAGQTEINSRDFYFALVENLKPYINDSHFIISHFTDETSFSERKFAAWSDIFVTKNGDEYIVSESSVSEVTKGDKYTDDIENLFYYPVKGEQVYRIGALTDENTPATVKSFSFNGKNVSVPVKQDGAIQWRPMKYKEFETADSAYIELNDFMTPAANSSSSRSARIVFRKFVNLGEKYNSKKNIILDLRNNHGGDPIISALFFYGLYKNCKVKLFTPTHKKIIQWNDNSFFERKLVYSPVYLEVKKGYCEARNYRWEASKISEEINLMKKNPIRKVVINKLKPSKMFKHKPKFKGKVIILTDRNTVSAGEFATVYAKHMLGENNVIVVGENTYGMAAYWNIMDVELPNSKINVHTAFGTCETIRKDKRWHGEGTGLFPDWWCSGSDLNDAIFLISGDNEMKEKLKNIEFYLM